MRTMRPISLGVMFLAAAVAILAHQDSQQSSQQPSEKPSVPEGYQEVPPPGAKSLSPQQCWDEHGNPLPPKACASKSAGSKTSTSGSRPAELARIEERFENLESTALGFQKRLEYLEQKESAINALRASRAAQLNQLKSELAKFDCHSDQDRAFAAALADGKPVHTYEGAAAMECTERLKTSVEKIIQMLEEQE